MKSQFQTGLIYTALGLSATCFVLSAGPTRHAAAQADPARVTWEYNTANVDSGSLQTKLAEFGDAGWEVFAITLADSKVEQGPDGIPHLTTVRMDVTATRAKLK